jgi:hypothetical protein
VGVGVACGGSDGGVTDADAAVSTASDGAGAGVPTGVGGGSVGVAWADGVTTGVGVAVGTAATFKRPAPERARGTVPSSRKRIAMIPRPQRR